MLSFKLDAKNGTEVLLKAMVALHGVIRRYGAIVLLVILLVTSKKALHMETTAFDDHTDVFEPYIAFVPADHILFDVTTARLDAKPAVMPADPAKFDVATPKFEHHTALLNATRPTLKFEYVVVTLIGDIWNQSVV